MRRFVCCCEGSRIRRTEKKHKVYASSRYGSPSGIFNVYFDAEEGLRSIRCNCPYVAVYRLSPLNDEEGSDCKEWVYKAHKVDTFHNHKLDNTLMSSSQFFRNQLPKDFNSHMMEELYSMMISIEEYAKSDTGKLLAAHYQLSSVYQRLELDNVQKSTEYLPSMVHDDYQSSEPDDYDFETSTNSYSKEESLRDDLGFRDYADKMNQSSDGKLKP